MFCVRWVETKPSHPRTNKLPVQNQEKTNAFSQQWNSRTWLVISHLTVTYYVCVSFSVSPHTLLSSVTSLSSLTSFPSLTSHFTIFPLFSHCCLFFHFSHLISSLLISLLLGRGMKRPQTGSRRNTTAASCGRNCHVRLYHNRNIKFQILTSHTFCTALVKFSLATCCQSNSCPLTRSNLITTSHSRGTFRVSALLGQPSTPFDATTRLHSSLFVAIRRRSHHSSPFVSLRSHNSKPLVSIRSPSKL